MNTFLSKCRASESEKHLKKEIGNTVLLLLLGLVLGVFAKWLDSVGINNRVLWQRLLGKLDLRNVFSRISIWALLAAGIAVYSKSAVRAGINVFLFFVGMLAGYYTYTILISGFFPKSYMLAWGIITLFTPILAFLAWYAKGNGWFAVMLSAIIIGFFFSQAFFFGMWYFRISYVAESIFSLLAILILYKNRKQFLYTLLSAVIAAPFIELLVSHIWSLI